MATAAFAALLAVSSFGLVSQSAQAATGDTWAGEQVVDVIPAATTQINVIGLMPHYTGGGSDLYLWNALYMAKRDSDGHKSWVFCIQAAVNGSSTHYTEGPSGTAAAQAHMPEINRVLAESTLPDPGSMHVTQVDPAKADPSVHVLPDSKSDHIEITAIQLALWHYSDGLNFTTSNTSISKDYYPASYSGDAADVTMADVIARYDELVATADANPLESGTPSINIAPHTKTAPAGTAQTFDVTATHLAGSIDVSSDNGAIDVHEANGDGTCKTAVITTLPASGGTVCVNSPVAAHANITVKGQSAKTSTHTLFAKNAQDLVSMGPEKVSDSACATWTKPPPPTGGLQIVKTNNPTSETTSSFGDTLTYGLTATATGDITQHAVVVTDDIPGYGDNASSTPTTYVDGSAACVEPPVATPANCGITTSTSAGKVTSIHWALGDLAAGESRSVTFKVTIDVAPTNPEGNGDAVLTTNCATVNSTDTPGDVKSNCVENPVRVVTAVGDTDSSCVDEAPYFNFQSDGWFANESVKLHILDKNGNELEVRMVQADANGHIDGHELWPGFSVNPVTGVKTYPGLDVRPVKFFLSGGATTPTVTVQYPPPAAKCDVPLTIVKSNDPTGTVVIGDTISYKLAVTVPDNASFDQTGVVVTDYVPGYDPSLPDSGTTTYVSGSAACTGTILPTVGKCDVTLTKNSDGKVVKITWALGSMKAGQTTNAVFKVTVDDQDLGSDGTITVDNVATVASDYWPPTTSNKVTNDVEAVAVLASNKPNTEVLAATGSNVLDQAVAGLFLLMLGLVLMSMTRARDPRGRPVARVSWRRVT